MKSTGAEAVHPGYGFLSENASFVERLKKEGLVFIGPDSHAIHAMGDKIESKKLAIAAGVNTIPGFMGVLKDEAEAVKVAREIGYPVMIKASAGGGGKGMRIAWNDAEAAEGFRLSKAEAASSFGDDRLFVEKYLDQPRHIEIQIVADAHGNVVYLPERECSIQRRNQKVIEEAPSMCLDEATWRAMGEQACSLARAVQYKSAGTVEMMVDANRKFYFLEMNTRLQVEHPVTEMVTGLDLVEIMLRVAAGERLPLTQADVKANGWAFEARVYAEDPLRGFLPSIGSLQRYRIPDSTIVTKPGESMRVDTGVEEGSEISIHYDPMIAKLITHGPDRQTAAAAMRRALDSFVIRGVGCNINFMRDVMAHPRFLEGRLTTGFIPEEFPDGYHGHVLKAQEASELAAVAAILNMQHEQQARILLPSEGSYIGGKPSVGRAALVSVMSSDVIGQKDLVVTIEAGHGGAHEAVKRELRILASKPKLGQVISSEFEVRVEGEATMRLKAELPSLDGLVSVSVRTVSLDPESTSVPYGSLLGDTSRVVQVVQRLSQGYVLSIAGTPFKVTARTPRNEALAAYMPAKIEPDHSRELIAPMPGRLHSIAVAAGDKIVAGQELCVMEAMKMQNVLRAIKDGVVKRVVAKVGDTVSVDQTILELE